MRKLIIISNVLYVRNYIEMNAFNNILDDETYIACAENITDKESIYKYGKFAGEIGVSNFNKSLFGFVTELLMYSNRKVNKGFFFYFKIRHTTVYFKSLRLKKKVSEWCKNKLCRSILVRALEFPRPFIQMKKLIQYLLIVTIDFLGLTKFIVKLYVRMLPVNKTAHSIINKIKPDLVLMPNGGLDPLANDVFCLAHRSHSFKTMFLIDNWDNLCSKSTFSMPPDYLCVWGEQAKGHAKKFHGIDSSRVFLAGSPRFDVYYKFKANKKMVSGYENLFTTPYILFAGCWPPFDEISVLEELNGLVDKYKDLLPEKCKILYRPHPWGENYDKLDYLKSLNLMNIDIDPQILKSSRPEDYTKRTDFQPKLDYYPFLLDSSEFVICPLSSMTIEASIMGKSILVLAHDDGKSLLNPAMMYKNSDYFDRFSDMTNISLLHELKNLDNIFYQMITSPMPVDRKALSYYIVEDERPYPERIESIYNQVSKCIS